ncbi:ead/Ea22-like family protein [Klebsiella pneumoniae]|uniref:ead/Ea22-like family protein n=1 Tax=Klebsiella pneumoniae TaxID=573 RepID=UPI000B41E102|nr:ead/Ea22-like family protein [Klebsiella pneumoniae]OWA99051.1 hypothetical protein BV377_12080 [Klebsiella pneumoniae]QST09952.1 hypothetical protein J0G22_21635 [Klebsiella pneumoniae]RTQ94082.1 hypothetical protein EKL47_28725 [Klebsiella pneumoniae]RTR07437.1 hypothetical protein EKL48_28740 [Klebsiella pneumoniae]RUL46620.1 hypothetical protein ELP97_01410 [Klebsiella pneumoniae subsp. pneumoniae]
MTDITERAQSLKAAAENAIGAHERLAAYPYGEIIDISQHEGEQIDIDITDLNEFNKEANPVNIIALVEALEKAQAKIIELQRKYEIDPRTHEIIDLEERVAELESEIEKWKQEAEAWEQVAEKQLATAIELESRTVKLPKLKMLEDYLAEVAIEERKQILVGVKLEFHRALAAAGIKVEVE